MDAKEVPTRSGDGSHLVLTFEILDGEHKGRMVWARLCIHHDNPTAQRIARSQLSSICRAVNVLKPDWLPVRRAPRWTGTACP